MGSMGGKTPQNEAMVFDYLFEMKEGEPIAHRVEVSRDTLLSKVDAPAPEWAKLEFHQCEGCPLKGVEHCPVAIRFTSLIDQFKSLISYTQVKVTVKTEDRSYSKDTDFQDGLRSLFGLIMATSGCPVMEPFKPMARFHLPFASMDETVYRVVSSYLLQRFFMFESQKELSFDIHEIQKLYDSIQRVNHGMFARLTSVAKKDGMLNAVTILDSMSTLVPFYVESKLGSIRNLFVEDKDSK